MNNTIKDSHRQEDFQCDIEGATNILAHYGFYELILITLWLCTLYRTGIFTAMCVHVDVNSAIILSSLVHTYT